MSTQSYSVFDLHCKKLFRLFLSPPSHFTSTTHTSCVYSYCHFYGRQWVTKAHNQFELRSWRPPTNDNTINAKRMTGDWWYSPLSAFECVESIRYHTYRNEASDWNTIRAWKPIICIHHSNGKHFISRMEWSKRKTFILIGLRRLQCICCWREPDDLVATRWRINVGNLVANAVVSVATTSWPN